MDGKILRLQGSLRMTLKGGKTMASSKEYLDYVLEQLSELDDITYKAMMGEYILYYRGKIFGGVYDDRFLVKNTKSAAAKMPEAELQLPYEGAKEMLLVDDIENKEFLAELVEAMYDELPAPKKKR
jgi:TfoX/Sxy family transcriptional regulator of competence genes